MTNIQRRILLINLLFLLFFSLLLFSIPAQAEERTASHEIPSFAADEALFWGEEEKIITATKFEKPLKTAPAIAAVISAEEIRNMGARDLIDVLKRIPGIAVTKGYYGKEEIEVRGIKTANSEKVKLLIDGYSVNDNVTGGAVWSFDSLSVDNVKRIEIIRGPGSALYGSNAFSAVINVITKSGDDIDGVIVSAGGGSFDTGRYNIQAGRQFSDLAVALSMDYLHTNGARLKINSDSLGNSGDTSDWERRFDLSLKIGYKNFTFSSKYVGKKRGPYLGVKQAVNNESEIDLRQFLSELKYKYTFNKYIGLSVRTYFDELDWDAYWEIFPEGAVLPGGSFPDGMIGNPSLKERTFGTELQMDYNLLSNKVLTLGILGEKRRQFDVKHIANFDPTTGAPLASIQDITSWANWNQDKTRDIWAAYLQDVWDITDNIGLTLGVRHDHYSDFGDTTNPRAALVWGFLDDWDIKLLYGTAFRAPTFEELYNANNPSVKGNADLKAEKMQTYEISMGYAYNKHTRIRINYFYNKFDDRIELVPQPAVKAKMFENTGGAKVDGIEAEIKRKFTKDNYVYANYTFQDPVDKDTGKRLADVPAQKGNVGANIALLKYLNANVNLFVSGNLPRADGDSRKSIPSYGIVDLTIIARNFYKGFEVRAAVKNLLDKQYADPAPVNTAPVKTVKDDFPREGINFMIEMLYKF